MNYAAEMLEIWWLSLSQTMRDQTMRFPMALVIGVLLAGVLWLLAAYSARLWNRRFYLNVGLQVLCGIAAVLTLFFTLTFASSDSLKEAVRQRLDKWEYKAKNDAVWKDEAFKRAYDEVAVSGSETTVKKSPTPRTDPSITTLPMNNPNTKKIVARSHAFSALEYFNQECPYLASVLNAPGSIPDDILNEDLIDWFTKNPGTSYPQERGISVLLKILKNQGEKQIEPVVSYTKRLSLGLFIVTQFVVFALIALLAYRSIRPTL